MTEKNINQEKEEKEEKKQKVILPYVIGFVGVLFFALSIVVNFGNVKETSPKEPLPNQLDEQIETSTETITEPIEKTPPVDNRADIFISQFKEQDFFVNYLANVEMNKTETSSSFEMELIPLESFHPLSINEKKTLILAVQSFITENWKEDCEKYEACKISSIRIYSEEEKYGYEFTPTGVTLVHLFTDKNGRNQSEKLDLQSTLELSDNNKFEYSGSIYIEGSGSIALDNESLTGDGDYLYFKGMVVNNTDKPIYFVTVGVDYYDSNEPFSRGDYDNGTLVETDYTYAVGGEGLQPGKSKSFKITTRENFQFKWGYQYIQDYQF